MDADQFSFMLVDHTGSPHRADKVIWSRLFFRRWFFSVSLYLVNAQAIALKVRYFPFSMDFVSPVDASYTFLSPFSVSTAIKPAMEFQTPTIYRFTVTRLLLLSSYTHHTRSTARSAFHERLLDLAQSLGTFAHRFRFMC